MARHTSRNTPEPAGATGGPGRKGRGPEAAKRLRRAGGAGASDGVAITCSTRLLTPRAGEGKRPTWAFLVLPAEASAKLPSRGQVSATVTLNGAKSRAMLEPDGRGGHWLRVSRVLRLRAGAEPGDTVRVELIPASQEPEPKVPADLRRALSSAGEAVRAAWADITPAARRDFVHWVTSPRRAETRAKRINVACDMLAKGKRRPCCFDRSGMYSGSLSCPVAEGERA